MYLAREALFIHWRVEGDIYAAPWFDLAAVGRVGAYHRRIRYRAKGKGCRIRECCGTAGAMRAGKDTNLIIGVQVKPRLRFEHELRAVVAKGNGTSQHGALAGIAHRESRFGAVGVHRLVKLNRNLSVQRNKAR